MEVDLGEKSKEGLCACACMHVCVHLCMYVYGYNDLDRCPHHAGGASNSLQKSLIMEKSHVTWKVGEGFAPGREGNKFHPIPVSMEQQMWKPQ